MNIEDIQNEIINEFQTFRNWEDKYEYIIEQGYALPKIPAGQKTPENLIKECQSKVWLYATLSDGKINYYADSEAVIIKGLIALIVRVVSGHSAQEISDADLFFIQKTGLSDHFSNRSTGLKGMINKVRSYAETVQMAGANL